MVAETTATTYASQNPKYACEENDINIIDKKLNSTLIFQNEGFKKHIAAG